jgi:hypothetical protein
LNEIYLSLTLTFYFGKVFGKLLGKWNRRTEKELFECILVKLDDADIISPKI